MEKFVSATLNGRAIEAGQFSDGSWVFELPRLMAKVAPLDSSSPFQENGAAQAAKEIKSIAML